MKRTTLDGGRVEESRVGEGRVGEGRVGESRALTGLRGVGALLVMAHHLYLRVGLDQHMPFLQWGLRKGYLGVDLFFVLSGFILSMVYGSWFQDLKPSAGYSYLPFMLRRVARIWPLHAAMVLILLGLRWMRGQDLFTPRVVLENLAMVQAWGHSTEINVPAWSISTEFMAYLLFPLLAAFALRGTRRPLLAVAGVVLALWTCVHYAPPIGPIRRGWLDIYYNFSPLPALRSLSGFVVGMLAWRAGQFAWVQRIATRPAVGGVALLAMLAMMVGRVNDLLIFLLLPVIVLGLHFGKGPVQRALAHGPLHALGVISYAVYLVHFALLRGFPFAEYPMRAMLPAYILSTLALATAAHLAIERPGRRALRAAGSRLLDRLGRQPVPSGR